MDTGSSQSKVPQTTAAEKVSCMVGFLWLPNLFRVSPGSGTGSSPPVTLDRMKQLWKMDRWIVDFMRLFFFPEKDILFVGLLWKHCHFKQ